MTSKPRHYTLKQVFGEGFIDEDNNFNPDIADSSSNSSGQLSERNRVGKRMWKRQTVFSADFIMYSKHQLVLYVALSHKTSLNYHFGCF